ncbi:hypothetical protein KOR42_49990 [Thalassoglobus neptunius]|uniref:Uncharacterized protein n=1 Tax=Thalassoglobus neptunius TaxID=1938619 RepID=A0A5C5VNB0_9PLAN|nr:hypothetical protein [Thalassoglobus neptunius]TWT40104.1 hypothetical protein KOR42_49990 [Thalassoglobus neptunius]
MISLTTLAKRPCKASQCFALLAVGTLFISGCDQKQMEDAENSVKEGASELGESASDAATQMGEAAKNMKDAMGEKFTAAWDKASEKLKEVEGGSEMLTNIKDFFKNAGESLSSITDEASAENAKAKFAEMTETVEGWGPKLAEMPEEAQTALKSVLASGAAHLKTLVEKVKDNELYQEHVQPQIDALMEKLHALAG